MIKSKPSKRLRCLVVALVLTAGCRTILADAPVLPEKIASFLANHQNGVTDEGLIVRKDNGSDEFVHYVSAHWKEMVANCSAIAPDTRRQSLLAAAAEALPPSDYVDFLDSLCDLIASGKIIRFDIYSITDGVGQKEGFLACNYDNPRVAIVIQKLEALCVAKRPNDPDVEKAWAEMKSGQAKIKVAEFMKENGRQMPQVLVESGSPVPRANLPARLTGPK